MSDWRKQTSAFADEMTIAAPAISSARIKMGFFGSSGSGKSVTAGICAFGLAPNGTIGWIDGEQGRSGLASDVVCELAAAHFKKPKSDFLGRIRVIHVAPPFNPLKAVAAIQKFEAAGVDVIIADLMTQCWNEDGGYLDLKEDALSKKAGDNVAERMRNQSSIAAQVKPWTHGKLVSAVNQCNAHLILCFQGKQKYNMADNKPDKLETPIQESGITRTLIACGRVEANAAGEGGYCHFTGPATKHTHPSVLACLPKPGDQFAFVHSEKIRVFLSGKDSRVSEPKKPATPLDEAKLKLWNTLKRVHGEKGDRASQIAEANAWLISNKIINPGQSLADLNLDQIKEAISKSEVVLEENDITP